MGVQDRDGTGVALELAIVLGKGLLGLPDTAAHQGVAQALMRPGQPPEFGRQREGHQKISRGHLFVELTLQPLLTLMMLAEGTVAVTTRMATKWSLRGIARVGRTRIRFPGASIVLKWALIAEGRFHEGVEGPEERHGQWSGYGEGSNL